MTEDMLAPTGFVLAAAMCWAMYVNGARRMGNAGLALALIGLWSLAVLKGNPTVHHARSTVQPRPSTLHAAELIVNRPSSTAVISTLDKQHAVYHLPSCRYAKQIVRHREEVSEAEAIEAGYVPCSICLSRGALTARSEQP